MTSNSRSRIVIAATGLAAVACSSLAAFADTSTVPVTTLVATGTRTLSVTDVAGAAVGAGGLPLGAGHGGAFLVNVSDTRYKNAGYQVSATMTNLYPYAGGNFDFNGTPIPSSAVSVDYPGGALDLLNVKSLVAPVVTLTGTLNLGPILGNAVSINQVVDGGETTVQSLADTITKGTLAAALSELPVTLQTGETGAFSAADGLPGEPGSHANPTSKVLMSGDAQQPLKTALLSALNTTLGGDTAQQLIDAGILDQTAVVAAVAQQLGVAPNLFTAGQITSMLTTLTSTVTDLVGNIIGQTGSYNTMPALSIDVPSSASAGVYRGQLVVTLMDK
ncbi:MAG: hypothetical protein QOJ03_2891 [Frankiaceae bacterium]|nr:hypothetical protein [Frankiaceae bacterium]